MTAEKTLLDLKIPGVEPLYSGKVRDIYEIDNEQLLLVASDRISAFDVVFPNGIPKKGRALTRLATFWFHFFENLKNGEAAPGGFKPAASVPQFHLHFINDDITTLPAKFIENQEVKIELIGRSMIVRRATTIPYEFIVRWHLDGSAWNEYQEEGTVWGKKLPEGMQRYDVLPEPLFTPTTKAHEGHDLPVTWEEFVADLGEARAVELRDLAFWIFQSAHDYLETRGIILEDTKFEFGTFDGDDTPVVIDEIFTSDSSRFLLIGEDGKPKPFDKQYLRDAVKASGWDGNPPAPRLPDEIVAETTRRYTYIADKIIGNE